MPLWLASVNFPNPSHIRIKSLRLIRTQLVVLVRRYCPAGTARLSDAVPCPAGKYGVATNGHALESTACMLCPNGKRGKGSTGIVGEDVACEACAPGKSSAAGSPVCYFICAMGEYLDGVSSCQECSPGSYSNNLGITGSSACTPCENGYGVCSMLLII